MRPVIVPAESFLRPACPGEMRVHASEAIDGFYVRAHFLGIGMANSAWSALVQTPRALLAYAEVAGVIALFP